MFYKPSKFWDKFTLTHLIVLLSVRIVPEHSDKPVTKDSIRTRVCCFSFTVMWELYQHSFRISKCTDLKNTIILYTILSTKGMLLDCSQSPTFPSDHPDQVLWVTGGHLGLKRPESSLRMSVKSTLGAGERNLMLTSSVNMKPRWALERTICTSKRLIMMILRKNRGL